MINGLGFIPLAFCPHYDRDKGRKDTFKKMMRKENLVGIALDDCVAIEIVNDSYKIITSKKKAKAYRVFWRNGKYYEQDIEVSGSFKQLKNLL